MDLNKRETLPTHSILLPEQVYCVSFSPYEWSQNLLCVAMTNKITVGTIKFQEVNDELQVPFKWSVLREFHNSTRCHALCWSPDTSLSVLPKVVLFCVAGADFQLRIMRSDMLDNDTVTLLSGHTDYVNSISWESEGEYIASVSDDHTVKLWNTKITGGTDTCVATFYLSSPGMDVCWHAEESGKLLAAEKNGLIHLYNIHSQQAILSLDAGSVPLMSAHWAPSNGARVAAIASGELIVWDMERPSRPIETRPLHEDGGRFIRFSAISDLLLASVGRPNNTLKVTHTRVKLPQLTSSLMLFGGLTWHYMLPYVCVANDRKLCFWKVSSK